MIDTRDVIKISMCDHSTNQSSDTARKCCAEMVEILSTASIN